MHPYIHWSAIYNSQDLEAAQVPISRWVDKTTMGYLHNGILLGHKKEENFTFCDSMDGPREHYAKWNKPIQRKTNAKWFHLYVETNAQTELTRRTETDS